MRRHYTAHGKIKSKVKKVKEKQEEEKETKSFAWFHIFLLLQRFFWIRLDLLCCFLRSFSVAVDFFSQFSSFSFHRSLEFKSRFYSMALIVWLVFHKSDIAVTKDVYRMYASIVYKVYAVIFIAAAAAAVDYCVWNVFFILSSWKCLCAIQQWMWKLSNNRDSYAQRVENRERERVTKSFGWHITVLNAKFVPTVVTSDQLRVAQKKLWNFAKFNKNRGSISLLFN